MSKELANSDSQIEYVEALIEALKRQRERFERLMIILRENQQVLDQWTTQYFELLKMKHDLGLKLISLPQSELKQLERTLGSKALEECENTIEECIVQLMLEGKILTIAEMESALAEIDDIIVELIIDVQQIRQGKKVGFLHAKDIILKRVVPIGGGIALIALDIPSQNWLTIVGGGVLVCKGFE